MLQQTFKRLSRVSPHVAIAGALIIVVVIAGVTLLLTRGGSEANANPSMQPRAARLDRVDGSVGIARTEGNDDQQLDWAEGAVNTPITVGDRIFARDYAHASVALTGHNFVRLNPATSLDVLALEDRRTQFALRSGSALFDIGALTSDELFEVATPCGAVAFKEPGLYQIGMEGSDAIISVLNGRAQIVGQEGTGFITKGQVFTLAGASATEALASTLAPDTAGEIVDDYYRYRYPKVYNGRYRNYDDYLADPAYYDPYRTSVSYQYLPADIPGLYDLDYYGDWVDVGDYGHCWAPRVSSGWAPFRSGYWDLDDLWGPSWVSYEPWGWAPYHYGRWAFVNQRWFWVPLEVRTHAVYCPAPVAFIPVADQIAWVPLGPGEVYVSRYYDNFQPRYLASADVVRVVTVQNTFVNFNAPGAVTAVPVRSFTRTIEPGIISQVDTVLVGKSRAVIDPFSVSGVRELAIRHDDGRRRIKIARQEQDALNTAVVASASPGVLPTRGNLAKRLKVEAAPENRREGKLKIKETSEVTSSRRADGLPQPVQAQSQRMSELAGRAEQGDKSARREMRQLMREEQRATKAPGSPQAAPPAAQQQAQQEQLQQQLKQQRRAERQQQQQNEQAARQAQQQQMKQQQQLNQQRKAERQQQSAAAQQQMRQQNQQQQQMRQQKQQQQQMRQQQQQMRQQKQQQQQMRQQQQQMRQQRKEPKRKPPAAFDQQQLLRQAQRSQGAQQQAARAQQAQRQAAMQQQAARAQQAQRQAAMQQQAARAQQAQRQAAMQQQAARAQQAQRQAAMQQQAARAQQAQRQAAMQQQAARAQQAQRQAVPAQRSPALLGPPIRKDSGAQVQRRVERPQRKPPQ
jgi:hypothetical protein